MNLISPYRASREFRLPFCYETLLARIEAGKCPCAVRKGKRWLLEVDEFQRWIQRQV